MLETEAAALTARVVDRLALRGEGETVMDLVLALRVPYPQVQQELDELAALGVVVRRRVGRGTRWVLG